MFSQKLRQRIRQALWGQRPPEMPLSPSARYAAFLLIALLTLLIMLSHYLGMSVPAVIVLVCYVTVAVMTGALLVYTFAHRSGRE